MQQFFYPRSVAIVGVSEAPDNLGRNIAANLDQFGFPGDVHLVGRSVGCVEGRSIHPSLQDIPVVPDLAVLLIPAQAVPDAMEACGRQGIRRVVIESGGFSEFSEESQALERRLVETARKHGIRFVGPNCIGIVNLDNGLVLPFMKMDPRTLRRAPVSLISQSGGVVFGGAKLFSCENVGCNKLISMGNKLDVNESDYLEYLIQDPGTRVIGVYLESVSDGRRLMELAASTHKPVIVLKANTTPSSREIARFHTAALAGDDAVCDAALTQAGMHRVRTFGELVDYLKVFQLPPMRGPNLAVIGRSGGQSVMAADAAAALGFRLPRFAESLLERVRQRVRAGVIRMTNPMDLGDVFELGFYTEVVEAALAEPEIDGVLLQHLHGRVSETQVTVDLFRAVAELSRRYDKPVTLCFMSERDEWFPVKTATDFPIFLEPFDAIRALAASLRHARRCEAAARPFPGRAAPPVPSSGQSRLAGPAEVFARLRKSGISTAEYVLVEGVEEALAAAGKLGYPVAIKIAEPDVVHKTEAGGVKIGIEDDRGLAAAVCEMQARFAKRDPSSSPQLLVQAMAPDGVEVIVGSKRDAEFGPVVLLGLGGIFAEVFQDVALAVAPITEDRAEEMTRQLRAYPMLAGYRGRPAADLESLRRAIVHISSILVDSPEIEDIEVNPLLVLLQGKGCVAVDGRMRVRN